MGGNWVGQLRYQRTQGAAFCLDEPVSAEEVADRWDEVVDFSRVSHPQSTQEGFEPVMRNLTLSKDNNRRKPSVVQSTAILERLAKIIKREGRQLDLVRKVNGVIQWNIGRKSVWTVDLAHGYGKVEEGSAANPDVTFTMSEENFVLLSSGKLKPPQVSLFVTLSKNLWFRIVNVGFNDGQDENTWQYEIRHAT